MKPNLAHLSEPKNSGKLRIGDNWNAIRIIALSQSNPLKAVAEFVENSIDAKAKHVTLIRGKEKGAHFLRIKDDGEGIRRNAEGVPDFEHVATHICDSVKRTLKADGVSGLQGEFGIGLLSFWTVGEELSLTSAGSDGKTYQMHMKKGDPAYRITQRRLLIGEAGTELVVRNILPGIKQFSGEKIQWYLASELRDRIRLSGVEIRVIDRTARAEFKVEPRKFEGRLLHQLSRLSELYLEIYLTSPGSSNAVGLFRHGTRVLDNLASLSEFNKPPWTSGHVQGLVDVAYLNLTPGTRTGIIQDEAYQRMTTELAPVEAELLRIIDEQQRAEDEKTSHEVLRSIQKAIKEALLALPIEEYDWFDVHGGIGKRAKPAAEKPALEDASGELVLKEGPDETSHGESEADQNVVLINNGHRDFVFASRNKALKLRYICRLFAKELVVKNFAGAPPGDLLERLIELSLYTEEYLK